MPVDEVLYLGMDSPYNKAGTRAPPLIFAMCVFQNDQPAREQLNAVGHSRTRKFDNCSHAHCAVLMGKSFEALAVGAESMSPQVDQQRL
jgi:hypothetical protein